MVFRGNDVSFNDYIRRKYPNIILLDVLKFQKKIEDTNYIGESIKNLYIFASYYGTDRIVNGFTKFFHGMYS